MPVAIDAEDQAAQRAEAELKERHTVAPRLYLPALRGALGHPAITLAVAVLVLEVTVALIPSLETNFMGDIGGATIRVNQTFSAGTSLSVQDEQAQRTERAIMACDYVETVMTEVGVPSSTGISASAQPIAEYSLTLRDRAHAKAAQNEIRQALADSNGPRVIETTVESAEAAFLGTTTVDLVVSSTNPAVLAQAAATVEQAARQTAGAVDVTNSMAVDQPRVEVMIDREEALGHGLTESGVSGLLRGVMLATEIGSLNTGENEIPVVVSPGDVPPDVETLRDAVLYSTPAGDVKLSDVATVEVTAAPVTIDRFNGERAATVSATPESQDLGAFADALTAAVDALDLPAGVEVTIGGVSAQMTEAFDDLGTALIVAVMIVYIIMVATFGSLIQPFILLISIPFAATGALLALVVTATALGVPAFIGMLLLVGIVVANAIVLIDLINQYRAAGRPLAEAIEEGTRKRLRPILMTAAATIFALIPMALGLTGGGGSFVSQPLALVVIGGLVTSTALTLLVVPVLYQLEAKAHDRREARRDRRHESRRQSRIAMRAALLGDLAAPAAE
ncbi:MAG: efflux RND transporter permease subunit [Bifidobacteriaceae bacterium]|nr:efflux RND transporter permease subunit [Bifidobacteriaceae bacterium]